MPSASALQARMRAKLSGARFRWLNEALYSAPSGESASALAGASDGGAAVFAAYHAGFRAQVAGWPENPLHRIIAAVGAAAAAAAARRCR